MDKTDLEKLNDIVAGIGLSYLKRNQNSNINGNCNINHTNNSNSNINKNNCHQQIRNCILLRCNDVGLLETLQKCKIISYIKKYQQRLTKC